MNRPIFITGIGTGVGKTVVSAIIVECLKADYWKPIQAGFDDGTDALQVQSLISNNVSAIHPEVYKLKMPASPHIAAREDQINIDIDNIKKQIPVTDNTLIVEGAGGILVPLNNNQFIADLIVQLNARVILVSKNYLGSINHSLLTAAYCKQKSLDVIGWVFNEQYLNYQSEIAQWSNYPIIHQIPFEPSVDKTFVKMQADAMKAALNKLL